MSAPLFAWQRALLAAALPDAIRLTALRVALDSDQGTGRNVVIDAARVAQELGCSERTVWRRVQTAIADGWFVQTAKPTYGGPGERGRRARYALVIPGQSHDTSRGTMAHDDTESPAMSALGLADDTPRSRDNTSDGMAHDRSSRLTKRAQSSATTTPDNGTVLAFGSPSKAAAAAELPTNISILRSKLQAHTSLQALTFNLSPTRTSQLSALIELHGDERLVAVALRTCRNPAPVSVAAFFGTWEALPPPGVRLAAVKQRLCPTHGTRLTTSGNCSSCAADSLAGER